MTSDTKKANDPLANILVTKPKNGSADVLATRPKNLKANLLPTEGYGLEVDGRVKIQYDTVEAANKAALELKRKYPQVQVRVFDAKERTRTAVELPG